MTFNKYQSTEEDIKLESLPDEVQEEFKELLSVPFIKYMVSPERKRAKDLPRDSEGRIIVDITHPHILEDVDYFRPSALHYQKTGRFTDLKPNSNPNSAFGKWVLEEVKRCREGYVRESDGEWIPGNMYYFLNYCPIAQTKVIPGSKKGKRVIDFPEFWDGIYLRFHYIEQAQHGGIFDESGGKNGCEISSRGKAHPYSQIVYTPQGAKSWGEIKVGDSLFGDDGNPTKVINIPFDDYVDIYKVTLKDGRQVYASGNHLWKVLKRHYKNNCIIASTLEIKDHLYFNRKKSYRNPNGKEYIWAIPKNRGVEWEFKKTKVDPYTMGLCLGDASFRTPRAQNFIYYTSRDEDMLTYKGIVPYNIRQMHGKMKYHIDFPGIGNVLKEYGLYMKKSEDKFIPDEYIFNSREVRLNLLKGLMDSDGYVEGNGVPIITTSSKRMASNIAFVARSLGYNCLETIAPSEYKTNGVYKKCLDAYKIRIFTNDRLFNLERKQILVSNFASKYSRSNRDYSTIVNIEYSHKERAKCVTVDNTSNCYLIGDFVTTHNSKSLTMASIMSRYFHLGESAEINKAVKVMAMANTSEFLTNDGILNKFQSFLDFIANNTEFPHLLLQNSIKEMAWTLGWKDIDGIRHGTLNECMGLALKDDIGKGRGKRMNFIVGEEFGTFKNIREIYNIMLPSVQEGDYSFGTMYLIGCVCAGTKVWINNGSQINIENLQEEDGIVGFNQGMFNVGPVHGYYRGICKQFINEKINLGKKPCYRITLSNGNFLECSNDHPVLLCIKHTPRNRDDYEHRLLYHTQEFRKAEDLKVGDKVCESRVAGVFGEELLFDARLVGMLIGDGSYSYNNTPCYSSEDKELLDYIKGKYDWSLSTSHITKAQKLYEEIRVKGICKNLREIGIYGQTKTKKRLPDNYQRLNKQNTSLLLSGLVDTDGCIFKNKQDYGITIAQSSKEILEQTQLLFRKFGIIGTITTTQPKIQMGRKDKNPWYTLVISGRYNIMNAYKALKLLVPHKRNKLEEGYTWYINNPSKKEQRYPEDLVCRKIVKIEYLEEREIYNLSASLSHTYLANNIITHNTSGEKESDFQQAMEIVYNPRGYNMYPLPNVWDKPGEGRKDITFFYPEYLNRKECYDENGNSDVTAAIIEILLNRFRIKYNSTDPNTITRNIAERPITPQEAMLRSRGNIFPVSDLNARLTEIDNDSKFYDKVYVGTLVFNSEKVEFKPTTEEPIRIYPTEDNKVAGAIEFFELPDDSTEKIPNNRYIMGLDPVDADGADTMSLFSVFVLDLWTDRIVAEYTGRQQYADDNFEIARKLALFYNATILYESNIKGTFAYFSKMNSLQLLADTPEYLVDKQMVRFGNVGNQNKGVRASKPINNYADELTKNWLIQPETTIVKDEEGNDKEIITRHLFSIKNRALIQEFIKYNPHGNFDRIRAFGMLMLYREAFMIRYEGNVQAGQEVHVESKAQDVFFTRNF